MAKQPVFDLSLGQQTAYFQDLEAFTEKHLVYPDIAHENGIEGAVTLLLEISAQGKVTKA